MSSHLRTLVLVVAAVVVGRASPLSAQTLSAAELAGVQRWYRTTVRRTGPGTWGIAIGTVDGHLLWSANPDLELIPASTAKVFTTGFTRARVGGHATRTTRITGAGHVDPAGCWVGTWALDVVGDVTLERPDRSGPTLRQLAERLASRGIRAIKGPLMLTSHGGPALARFPSVWSSSIEGQLYAPPVGPVTLHENTVSFTFRPGRRAGERPTVLSTLPAGLGELVRIAAATVPGRRSRLTLRPAADGGWTLTGTIGVAVRSAGTSAVAHEPTVVMAYAWAAALGQAGIRWERRGVPAMPGPGEPKVLLAEVESAPLDTVASEVNRRSLNIGAELLLQWGAGNQIDGPRLVTQHVRDIVGPTARVHLVDGSGLSELDRVSPLTQMLYLARYPQQVGSERFPLLLPANGTGTLRRLRYGMGSGVVHAKTGTLDHVATLTGYLGRPDGVLVVSLMYNGARIRVARAAEWELFRLLGAEGVNLTSVIDTKMGGPSTRGDR